MRGRARPSSPDRKINARPGSDRNMKKAKPTPMMGRGSPIAPQDARAEARGRRGHKGRDAEKSESVATAGAPPSDGECKTRTEIPAVPVLAAER